MNVSVFCWTWVCKARKIAYRAGTIVHSIRSIICTYEHRISAKHTLGALCYFVHAAMSAAASSLLHRFESPRTMWRNCWPRPNGLKHNKPIGMLWKRNPICRFQAGFQHENRAVNALVWSLANFSFVQLFPFLNASMLDYDDVRRPNVRYLFRFLWKRQFFLSFIIAWWRSVWLTLRFKASTFIGSNTTPWVRHWLKKLWREAFVCQPYR